MDIEKKIRINTLVKEIGKGNEEAFEELYNLMYKELFYFFFFFTYDIEDIKVFIENFFVIVIENAINLLFYKNCYFT